MEQQSRPCGHAPTKQGGSIKQTHQLRPNVDPTEGVIESLANNYGREIAVLQNRLSSLELKETVGREASHKENKALHNLEQKISTMTEALRNLVRTVTILNEHSLELAMEVKALTARVMELEEDKEGLVRAADLRVPFLGEATYPIPPRAAQALPTASYTAVPILEIREPYGAGFRGVRGGAESGWVGEEQQQQELRMRPQGWMGY